MNDVQCIHEARAVPGEGPVWLAPQAALAWVAGGQSVPAPMFAG
jgi:sugar lactone lactonase YvrE